MNGQCPQFRFGNDGQPCTLLAAASVQLNITDSLGVTVPFATIGFTVDGGPVFVGGCNGDCGNVVLAFELAGRFDIEVRALGFRPATRTVNVSLDDVGCHPVTQQVAVVLERDDTVALLAGVWLTSSFFGDTVLRFGDQGQIIGAIFYDQTIGGDGNFYVSYNGRPIRGVAGQPLQQEQAPEPTRVGDVFNWQTVTLGIPAGFQNAQMSADFQTLIGMLSGQAITYTRLSEAQIPNAIRDP